MKYSFNLSNVEIKNAIKVENLKVDLEMSVEELSAQYNFVNAFATILKDAVQEIAPVFDRIDEKRTALRHSFRMEQMKVEHDNWRERFESERATAK